MIHKEPLISVLMPVYNGEKYLKQAIDSILNQTFNDFEFIVLNDGSTDRTEKIILSYGDQRIKYVKNETNLQIVKTLNKGIDLAIGAYIARMDADDMCLPNRFEKQIQFMEQHKHVDVCGTWISTISKSSTIWEYPITHEEIKASLLFNAALSHPSTLIRRSFFDTFRYDSEYNKAEDYHLWCQAIESKIFYNLPIPLYRYRMHNEMTNVVSRPDQVASANRVRIEMITRLGIIPHDSIKITHINFSLQKLDLNNINETCKWLSDILLTNKLHNYYDDLALKKAIGEYWWQLFSHNTDIGLSVFTVFMLSNFRKYSEVPPEKYITFLIKCIIKFERKNQ